MRLIITLIFVFLINAVGVSQSQFKLSIAKTSNLKVKIDTILAKDFDTSKVSTNVPSYLVKDARELLKSNLKKHKKSLVQKDSCIVLRSIKKDIKLCNNDLSKKDKSSSSNTFLGFQHGYLVFLTEGYEYWYFNFLVFSYGNCYGEGQFEILDLKSNSHFSLDSFNWSVTNFYRIDNKCFMEFTSNQDFKIKKFLRITY